MFMQGLDNGLFFLISLVLDLYIFLLIFRFILQKRYANYYNPITQFILKVTNPPVKPLQKIIPGIKGYDIAIIVLALIITAFEMTALLWLQYHTLAPALPLFIVTLGSLCEKILNLYFFCVIITVLMSWVPSLSHSPLAEIVHLVVDPIMRPVRRFIPPMGGFDLTPLPVLIGIKLVEIVLFDPLVAWGLKLAVIAPK